MRHRWAASITVDKDYVLYHKDDLDIMELSRKKLIKELQSKGRLLGPPKIESFIDAYTGNTTITAIATVADARDDVAYGDMIHIPILEGNWFDPFPGDSKPKKMKAMIL